MHLLISKHQHDTSVLMCISGISGKYKYARNYCRIVCQCCKNNVLNNKHKLDELDGQRKHNDVRASLQRQLIEQIPVVQHAFTSKDMVVGAHEHNYDVLAEVYGDLAVAKPISSAFNNSS
jgi:predicted metal-binding protein